MIQHTPEEFGKVKWRGGSGKPGTRGGWGFECKYPRCREGRNRGAAPTYAAADKALSQHWQDKHWHTYLTELAEKDIAKGA